MEYVEYTDEDRNKESAESEVEVAEEGLEQPEGDEEEAPEVLDGDENTEGAEEGDGSGDEAEGEDDTGESPDSEILPVVYEFNGQQQQVDASYDDIADAFSAASQLPAYQKYHKTVEPLIAHLEESEWLRNAHGWKAKGFSDKQIQQALMKSWTGQAENEEDADGKAPDLEELVARQLDKRLGPIQESMQQTQAARARQEAISRNDGRLNDALKKITGREFEDLSEGEVQSLLKGFQTVFGDADPGTVDVTPSRANLIIRDALVRVGKPKQGRTNQAGGIKSPPRVHGGGKSVKPKPINDRGYQSRDNVPDAERLEKINTLFPE